jgi:hypothetical protein
MKFLYSKAVISYKLTHIVVISKHNNNKCLIATQVTERRKKYLARNHGKLAKGREGQKVHLAVKLWPYS